MTSRAFSADEYEIRLAATEADLDSAVALDHWDKVEITVDQGPKKIPYGIRSRLQEVHETLLDYSGSANGHYTTGAVAGSSDVLTAFGMYEQDDVTRLYLRLTNKTSGEKVTLKKILAKPKFTIESPEGFAVWSVDFDFEDVSKT
jgi:hypothetical protein